MRNVRQSRWLHVCIEQPAAEDHSGCEARATLEVIRLGAKSGGDENQTSVLHWTE